MPESSFTDLPILGELGTALDAAMARELAPEPVAGPMPAARRSRRRITGPFRTFAIAILFAGLGTSTAAATLTVLRGSPIPVPRSIDVQPQMTPQNGTGVVLPLRSAGPGGGAPFALRQSSSETGLTCVTVGQSQGERFGVTGTDGVFRDLPQAVIDGCGQATTGATAVMGARVFDAPDRGDVRTVVYGVGGKDLERASVQVRGKTRAMEVKDGAFVLGLREYPEDTALNVTLEFKGGKTVNHPLGATIASYIDPEGPAWRVGVNSIGGWTGLCIDVGTSRPSPTTPRAPRVCGEASRRRGGFKEDYFVSSRTLRPGYREVVPGGGTRSWHQAPPRTMVIGYANRKTVKTVTVLGAGKPIVPRRLNSGVFLVPLLPNVDPATIRLRLDFADGAQQTVSGNENTITSRKRTSR